MLFVLSIPAERGALLKYLIWSIIDNFNIKGFFISNYKVICDMWECLTEHNY